QRQDALYSACHRGDINSGYFKAAIGYQGVTIAPGIDLQHEKICHGTVTQGGWQKPLVLLDVAGIGFVNQGAAQKQQLILVTTAECGEVLKVGYIEQGGFEG